MLKADKSHPVWLMIKGVEQRFATGMGIEQYMRDHNLTSCPIMAVQQINGEWLEVKHMVTGKIYQL